MKNIFDLEKTDDLPENVLVSISKTKPRKSSKNRTRIVALFETANRELTIDEIIVGYYRMFGIEKKRPTIIAQLHSFVKCGVLQRKKGCKGVFILNKEQTRRCWWVRQ